MHRQHTLSSVGLTPAETTLIQTIIRLSSEPHVRCWNWVQDPASLPDLDVLLLGPDQTLDPQVLSQARLRLFIGTPVHTPDFPHEVMPRPIRADLLTEWLGRHTLVQAPANPPLAVQASAPARPAATATAERPAITVPDALGNKLRDKLPRLFKLTRWPPSALLAGQPARIRMATLLSKRMLNVRTLAHLSGQPATVCEEFIQELSSQGIVETMQGAGAPPPSAPEAAGPAEAGLMNHFDHKLLGRFSTPQAPAASAPPPLRPAAPAPQPVASRSFFQSLRSRFGL